MPLLKRPMASSFSRFKSISLSNVLIWVMATYIIIDLGMHMSSSEHLYGQAVKGLQESSTVKVSERLDNCKLRNAGCIEVDEECNSVEAHMDGFEDRPRKPHDPWNQLKVGLPPADCPVNGLLIERLDPLNNYRRGRALGFTTDLDDRTGLDPWFLGSKVDLNKAKRRVLIDFGANDFTTSILYFMQRYPVDFTEIYAFETDPTLLKLPPGWDEDKNWVEPPGWEKIKSRAGSVPSWLLERFHFFTKFAGTEDNVKAVNVTRWMKEELNLKPEDTVIVKMDIEGAEWPILYQWVKDPQMPKIIDELFVELHYWHPDNGWDSMRAWSRQDATRMLAELRFKGFYTHYWD